MKKWQIILLIVAVVLSLGLVAGIGENDNTDSTLQSSSVTTDSTAILPPATTEYTESVSAESTAQPATESTTQPTAQPTTESTTQPTTQPTAEPTTQPTAQATESNARNYVLNTNTMKFHYPSCRYADDIKAENKATFYGDREDLLDDGYTPCGKCNP